MTFAEPTEGFKPPEGYSLRRNGGGRPTAASKHAAVFLARAWRQHLGESIGQADDWIMAYWMPAGKGDPAAIRAHIRKAKRVADLKQCFVVTTEDGFIAAFSAPDGVAKVGARAWLWKPPMREALDVVVTATNAQLRPAS